MNTTINSAGRQRLFRDAAEEEFGVKPWTVLITDDEKTFLLRALKKQFGHNASIKSRRLKRANDALTQEPLGSGQLKQVDFISNENPGK